MFEGLRLLGAILGVFMVGSSIAPQSEPLSTIDIWFNGFFGVTGVLLVLPIKKLVNYIRGKILASMLIVFATTSLITHLLILTNAGSSISSIVAITLLFYPLAFFNAYLYFNHAKL